ncbi:hypothetical protein [Natrinema sp. HArc-T2]
MVALRNDEQILIHTARQNDAKMGHSAVAVYTGDGYEFAMTSS